MVKFHSRAYPSKISSCFVPYGPPYTALAVQKNVIAVALLRHLHFEHKVMPQFLARDFGFNVLESASLDYPNRRGGRFATGN
jgi:hypothetical protein